MSELALQQLVAHDAARLILEAETEGYGVTLGEAWRSEVEDKYNAEHGIGILRSLHSERLAIDLNLFKPDGTYITDGTGHEQLSVFWKSLSPAHRWGGDFPKKDYNHYSLSPDSIRG